jgi:SpoVK/Ycf46/Vps4 family AAA+-type ATPase
MNLLFEIAIEDQPSVIVFDEIDSLGRTRANHDSESERRLKTEFYRQMDRLRAKRARVTVFATTNMPWEMDLSAMRRFERRILVSLPNKETRAQILRLHAGTNHKLSEEDIIYLAK